MQWGRPNLPLPILGESDDLHEPPVDRDERKHQPVALLGSCVSNYISINFSTGNAVRPV